MLAVFSFSAVAPAFASTAGRKNTALILTAATAYSVLRKNDRAALIGALATAQSWKSYEDSRKRDNKWKSQWYRSSRYKMQKAYKSSKPRYASRSRR